MIGCDRGSSSLSSMTFAEHIELQSYSLSLFIIIQGSSNFVIENSPIYIPEEQSWSTGCLSLPDYCISQSNLHVPCVSGFCERKFKLSWFFFSFTDEIRRRPGNRWFIVGLPLWLDILYYILLRNFSSFNKTHAFDLFTLACWHYMRCLLSGYGSAYY